MPLRSISSSQAMTNVRVNRASLWPDGRRDKTRLTGVATVEFDASFRLQPGEAVFTAGSCFARNIEKRFVQLGFDVPATALGLLPEERASDTENDFLNKYPPHAVLNEMRWALEPDNAYPEASFFELSKDSWHDPHVAPNVKPAPFHRVRERRALVTDLYSQIPRCRIFVLTLGLVEAWYDAKLGVYLNGAPPARILQLHGDRFRLDVLSVADITEALEGIYDLLARYGHPQFRMLLTVSPVPMRSTFTGRDVISANTYSKSALRVAAEAFTLAHDRVDYFPSYEIITYTDRRSAYIQDNRHVTPQAVEVIVDRVVERYCPNSVDDPDLHGPLFAKAAAREIRTAAKAKDFARAAELYHRLGVKNDYRHAGYDEFTYRFDFAKVLMRVSRVAEAQSQLAEALALNDTVAEAHYQHGRALARLQRPLDSERAFRRAVELDPTSIDHRLGWANMLSEMGDMAQAEQEVFTILQAHPGEPKAEAALEAMRLRRARAG